MYKRQAYSFTAKTRISPKIGIKKPKVLIPVFPGTNCEYDTTRAFINAGADPEDVSKRQMLKTKIAVFVSGGGTNFEALINAQENGKIPHGEIVLMVSQT